MVEQLFQLPLKSTRANAADLDSVARTIHDELETMGEKSFVDDSASSPRKKELTIMLDLVKDVIKTKQDENQAQRAKADKAALRQKLLDTLAAKKDEELTKLTPEQIEERLAALA